MFEPEILGLESSPTKIFAQKEKKIEKAISFKRKLNSIHAVDSNTSVKDSYSKIKLSNTKRTSINPTSDRGLKRSLLIRLVTKDPGPELNKFLVRYNHPLKLRWDFLILIFSVWNCFSLPVDIAFNPLIFETMGNVVFNHIIDFCFAFDIILHFRTTITDEATGTEITDPK